MVSDSTSNSSSDSDESNSSSCHSDQSNSSNQPEENIGSFKNSITLNPGFQPLRMCASLLSAEEFNSSDYDIWTVTLPGTVDAEKLKNIELSLSKSTKFRIEEEEFETVVHKHNENSLFLVSDKTGAMKITERQMAGTITIIKDVKIPKVNQECFVQAKKISQIPGGLKRRHPIYGKSLDAEEFEVKSIKQEHLDVSTISEKKKKKNKKQNRQKI